MAQTTKFFSSVEPKQSDRPKARKFVKGDEWIDDKEVTRVWNGTAWELPVPPQPAKDDGKKADDKKDTKEGKQK